MSSIFKIIVIAKVTNLDNLEGDIAYGIQKIIISHMSNLKKFGETNM
jgi:hypothetical protein